VFCYHLIPQYTVCYVLLLPHFVLQYLTVVHVTLPFLLLLLPPLTFTITCRFVDCRFVRVTTVTVCCTVPLPLRYTRFYIVVTLPVSFYIYVYVCTAFSFYLVCLFVTSCSILRLRVLPLRIRCPLRYYLPFLPTVRFTLLRYLLLPAFYVVVLLPLFCRFRLLRAFVWFCVCFHCRCCLFRLRYRYHRDSAVTVTLFVTCVCLIAFVLFRYLRYVFTLPPTAFTCRAVAFASAVVLHRLRWLQCVPPAVVFCCYVRVTTDSLHRCVTCVTRVYCVTCLPLRYRSLPVTVSCRVCAFVTCSALPFTVFVRYAVTVTVTGTLPLLPFSCVTTVSVRYGYGSLRCHRFVTFTVCVPFVLQLFLRLPLIPLPALFCVHRSVTLPFAVTVTVLPFTFLLLPLVGGSTVYYRSLLRYLRVTVTTFVTVDYVAATCGYTRSAVTFLRSAAVSFTTVLLDALIQLVEPHLPDSTCFTCRYLILPLLFVSRFIHPLPLPPTAPAVNFPFVLTVATVQNVTVATWSAAVCYPLTYLVVGSLILPVRSPVLRLLRYVPLLPLPLHCTACSLPIVLFRYRR